jgi:hypothetical protein
VGDADAVGANETLVEGDSVKFGDMVGNSIEVWSGSGVGFSVAIGCRVGRFVGGFVGFIVGISSHGRSMTGPYKLNGLQGILSY